MFKFLRQLSEVLETLKSVKTDLDLLVQGQEDTNTNLEAIKVKLGIEES